MVQSSVSDLTAVTQAVFSWQAQPDNAFHVRQVPTIARRVAYTLVEPDYYREDGSVAFSDGCVVVSGTTANMGLPLRNQRNKMNLQWTEAPFALMLRETDSFGEVLIELAPTRGRATAYSVTINRVMKGGVSHSSPHPEDQFIHRIGRFEFTPVPAGRHDVVLEAVEEKVTLSVDGAQILAFEDPDVAAGCVGIGSAEGVGVVSFEQTEYITQQESDYRADFARKMTDFCAQLDAEYDADVARLNSLSIDGNTLTWTYPETGAKVALRAEPGALRGEVRAGLYGDPRLLDGFFALPEIVDTSGAVYTPSRTLRASLEGDNLHFKVTVPLESGTGASGSLTLLAKFTENATWFCTAEVQDIDVKHAALAFGLDRDFKPLSTVAGVAGEPAKLAYGPSTMITDGDQDPTRQGFGLGAPADADSLPNVIICTDGVAGHAWKALSGQDTKIESRRIADHPALVLHSSQPEFRWALMWMPYHKLNLTGYKSRTLHFIRQPETPYEEYREHPSVDHYPTDEELERYAANGVTSMVWHHVWTGNNSRKRDGFVVNEPEMARAMKKAHELGIAVITYIGIVPGRHPVLRYEDLATRMFYDKNWDLQDFTMYSVAGRFQDFFPYMTDYWCREYGLDGYYTDGGLALLDWGYTGLSEADFGGLSLEELNDRLYSRVKRVLRRHNAGFGLENWGGSPIHLVGPFYDCRMIGESFQERDPETYRDGYNPLLTATPFKMYGMDLTARNRYNIAMSAVCMTDIQICSGNYSWGCWPDAPSDWNNLRPFWSVLDSIDWDNLIDAKPWWAQELVSGDGFFAGHYTTPERVVLFLANRTEKRAHISARVELGQLPEALRSGRIRRVYPEAEDWRNLGDGTLEVDLPNLHNGPVGFEIMR